MLFTAWGKVVEAEVAAVRDEDRPLHEVFKLPDIAGPGLGLEPLQGILRDGEAVPAIGLAGLVEEVLCQKGDVAGALA